MNFSSVCLTLNLPSFVSLLISGICSRNFLLQKQIASLLIVHLKRKKINSCTVLAGINKWKKIATLNTSFGILFLWNNPEVVSQNDFLQPLHLYLCFPPLILPLHFVGDLQ